MNPPNLPSVYVYENDIPPRLEWNHNGGYCGEVSMISAGLYYGQYLSQYDVRAIASRGMPQNSQSSSGVYNAQLLLGENAKHTAESLRLKYEHLESHNSEEFLAWIKWQVSQGHPVMIGVFNNEYLLYGNKTNPTAGDDEYDHIVPVIGFGSNHRFAEEETNEKYFSDDVILFSDNGLYTPDGPPPYYYYYFKLESFLADRQQANAENGNIYSLLDLPKYQSNPPKNNYGFAITGVIDQNSETLPVRVSTNVNHEFPVIASDSNERPMPMPLKLTITVSNLEPGVNYNLYYYKDQNDVPTENFNQHAKETNLLPWNIINIDSGTTWSAELAINSNEKAFFRAVEAIN